MSNNKLIIAEINTWVWLKELERKYARHMTLDRIPPNEWEEIIELGFNAIWLMGIWRRSSESRTICRTNQKLFSAYKESLPDWEPADIPGSPYSVKEYSVEAYFGGVVALEKVRKELAKRGIRLILDFVPNHLAIDNRWVNKHPQYFIQGNKEDITSCPDEFFQVDGGIFAYGKDPYFPAWQDVVQANAFSAGYRQAISDELKKIGRLCDGVRCDMAMLLLNDIFAKTWKSKAGDPPAREFWNEVISNVKESQPGMIFIAEAYWGKEWDLVQNGFDYCYDKRLYDRLLHAPAFTIRQHLEADLSFQEHLLRFIENHDEPRAATLLSLKRHKASALMAFTLPGASLLYEGQWEGRKIRNHVLLGRRQPERANKELVEFYKNLLPAVKKVREYGTWEICNATGWLNNDSYQNLISYTWQADGFKDLIIINFSDEQAQGRVLLPWAELSGRDVKLTDNCTQELFTRAGAELKSKGLFVDLPPWGYHFLSTYLR